MNALKKVNIIVLAAIIFAILTFSTISLIKLTKRTNEPTKVYKTPTKQEMRVVRDNIENEVKHRAIAAKRQEDKFDADNNVENADKTSKVNTAKVGEAKNDVGNTTQKANDANPNVIVDMPVIIPQKSGENKVSNQRVTISINRLIDILTGKSQQVDRSNAIYISTEGKVPPIEDMRRNTNPFGAIPEGFKPDIYIAPQNVDAAIKAFEEAKNSKLQPYIERLKAGENDIKWD